MVTRGVVRPQLANWAPYHLLTHVRPETILINDNIIQSPLSGNAQQDPVLDTNASLPGVSRAHHVMGTIIVHGRLEYPP